MFFLFPNKFDNFIFNLVYDGDDLKSGSIDVRNLAPALLAFSNLVNLGGRLVIPENSDLSVRVHTNFRKGSFDITLELAQAYSRFVELFNGSQIQAWSTLFSLLGFSGIGLFQLLKKGKGRKPRVLEIEHSEKVRIQFDGDDPVDIPSKLWELFNHPNIRQAVEKIVSPLHQDGIEKLELKQNSKSVLHVSKEESSYFKAPLQENVSNQILETTEAILKIDSLSFKNGKKWRFFNGNSVLNAGIQDDEFISKIDSGDESFRKGDILHVSLQTRQWMEGGKIKVEYDILNVLKHIHNQNNSDLLID